MHNHNLHGHIRYILFADLIKSYQSFKPFGHDYAILGPISHFPDGTIADQH
ncbi:hypothetical protein HMPREF0497_2065 [Lentilactobacillus buchneri ATCC 11577]|nr:hypothetical protein HMPREF0497_2065 [Lentilactobacillus buchneri ATCC 11577]